MQIVIEIDEKRYKDILRISTVQLKKRTPTLEQVIANGTPIPKGHGRLIDGDAFLNDLYQFCDDCGTLAENPYRDNPHIDSIVDVLENTPTVIPEDKEE